jgi:hypothetical protein
MKYIVILCLMLLNGFAHSTPVTLLDTSAKETKRNSQLKFTDPIGSYRSGDEPKSVSGGDVTEEAIEDGSVDLGETITQTPKTIANAVLAGGGRLLVIQYKGMPMLTVYDIAERKISKMIRIPDRDFIYTAGGYKALVYLKDNNLVSSFSLKTGKKLKTKVNPFGNVISHMLMGHMNDQVAFIRSADGTRSSSRAQNNLLNMKNLTAYELDKEDQRSQGGHNSHHRDFVQRCCSPDMQIITEWCANHGPQGFGVYKRYENRIQSKYEHSTSGYLAVGDRGHIYTSKGGVYSSDIKLIRKISGQHLFPGIGGSLFMGMDKNGHLSIYVAGTTSPVATIHDMTYLKDYKDNSHWKTTFTLNRRLIFNPQFNSIIIIPDTNDKIIHRGFDLESTLKSSGIDYLFIISQARTVARRGQKYTYKIKAKSNSGGITYDLEFGPDGMKISKDGTLTWKPSDKNMDRESVIVFVEDSGGEQIYHNFDINVQ